MIRGEKRHLTFNGYPVQTRGNPPLSHGGTRLSQPQQVGPEGERRLQSSASLCSDALRLRQPRSAASAVTDRLLHREVLLYRVPEGV